MGAEHISFVRIESVSNLIGGQPLSLANMLEVAAICKQHGIISVLNASLLQDNLYFIKTREEACKGMSIREITRTLCDQMDLIYFSSRKLGFSRGGGIISNNESLILKMKEYVPLYEGFLTYGGMEVRSMEAMAVGLLETMDEEIISQAPRFIEYLVKELDDYGVPMIMPAGGLGVHINATENIRPGHWLRPSTSPAAFTAWSAERFPSSASRTARSTTPSWNCCAWLVRAACSPCRK